MTSNISDLLKLSELAGLVRQAGVKLRMQVSPGRKRSWVSGTYMPGRILIYYRDRLAQAGEIASILIHEMGHHFCTIKWGLMNHTEEQAWAAGRSWAPAHLIPQEIDIVQAECLLHYATAKPQGRR